MSSLLLSVNATIRTATGGTIHPWATTFMPSRQFFCCEHVWSSGRKGIARTTYFHSLRAVPFRVAAFHTGLRSVRGNGLRCHCCLPIQLSNSPVLHTSVLLFSFCSHS